MRRARPVGILAGDGIYPKLLFDAISAAQVPVVVAGLAGQTTAPLFRGALDFKLVPLGALSATAEYLTQRNVEELYFAGGVRRSGAWRYCRPDRAGARLIAHALLCGDDRLLRATADFFLCRGIQVADPAEWLCDLFADPGLLAGPTPTEGARRDLATAFMAAKMLGSRDRGQGAVVSDGQLMATEDRSGTDALIGKSPAGGVLVKVVKPGQDRRFDLPAIGPRTIRNCRDQGLVAVGVEAGGVLILQRESTIAACNEAGISLVALENHA